MTVYSLVVPAVRGKRSIGQMDVERVQKNERAEGVPPMDEFGEVGIKDGGCAKGNEKVRSSDQTE